MAAGGRAKGVKAVEGLVEDVFAAVGDTRALIGQKKGFVDDDGRTGHPSIPTTLKNTHHDDDYHHDHDDAGCSSRSRSPGRSPRNERTMRWSPLLLVRRITTQQASTAQPRTRLRPSTVSPPPAPDLPPLPTSTAPTGTPPVPPPPVPDLPPHPSTTAPTVPPLPPPIKPPPNTRFDRVTMGKPAVRLARVVGPSVSEASVRTKGSSLVKAKKKKGFTPEEIAALLAAAAKGTKWDVVAEQFALEKGSLQSRNPKLSGARPRKAATFRWTEHESAALFRACADALERGSFIPWNEVAALIPGRSEGACRSYLLRSFPSVAISGAVKRRGGEKNEQNDTSDGGGTVTPADLRSKAAELSPSLTIQSSTAQTPTLMPPSIMPPPLTTDLPPQFTSTAPADTPLHPPSTPPPAPDLPPQHTSTAPTVPLLLPTTTRLSNPRVHGVNMASVFVSSTRFVGAPAPEKASVLTKGPSLLKANKMNFFTPEEDAALLAAVTKGTQWDVLVEQFARDKASLQRRHFDLSAAPPPKPATFRWTRYESAVLYAACADALERGLPIRWGEIAALIPGRSEVACRSHLVRSFPSLADAVTVTPRRGKKKDRNDMSDGGDTVTPAELRLKAAELWGKGLAKAPTRSDRARVPFTENEDAILIADIDRLNLKKNQPPSVSDFTYPRLKLPKRSLRTLYRRYVEKLWPTTTSSPKQFNATPKNVKELLAEAEKFALHRYRWREVQKAFPDYSTLVLRSAYDRLRPSPRRKWAPSEDARLLEAMAELGTSWLAIGRVRLRDRSPGKIKERMEHLTACRRVPLASKRTPRLGQRGARWPPGLAEKLKEWAWAMQEVDGKDATKKKGSTKKKGAVEKKESDGEDEAADIVKSLDEAHGPGEAEDQGPFEEEAGGEEGA
ncbi:hypothetical protein BDK51DRAFT_39472 [Blyttiomyces helicus]|uniref:Myb-like domain-containing protein n=1 Tax=Blyttiomyces helicus TaxID=388810 RepID=A0A4P9WET4_9FUNG|nr:hypothetical protein BDK51DRAFT_39472 [Blyttiomyces helicus]|eukprot:RKO91239.1 hypothetical protein BDK51DRAFT_39472 [Blyttiomyces helicus]